MQNQKYKNLGETNAFPPIFYEENASKNYLKV